MIQSKDRSYYVGASDTAYVVGNWDTKTFSKWYRTKQGIYSMDFTNEAMKAGTAYEHRILDFLDVVGMEKDKQLISGRLRVNLDGNTDDCIYEVKTHNANKQFRLTKRYKEQVYVQMYSTDIRNAVIVAYGLESADYNNYYRDIDSDRISIHEIKYNKDFIENEFIPKLQYISDCLDRGSFPKIDEYRQVIECTKTQKYYTTA